MAMAQWPSAAERPPGGRAGAASVNYIYRNLYIFYYKTTKIHGLEAPAGRLGRLEP